MQAAACRRWRRQLHFDGCHLLDEGAFSLRAPTDLLYLHLQPAPHHSRHFWWHLLSAHWPGPSPVLYMFPSTVSYSLPLFTSVAGSVLETARWPKMPQAQGLPLALVCLYQVHCTCLLKTLYQVHCTCLLATLVNYFQQFWTTLLLDAPTICKKLNSATARLAASMGCPSWPTASDIWNCCCFSFLQLVLLPLVPLVWPALFTASVSQPTNIYRSSLQTGGLMAILPLRSFSRLYLYILIWKLYWLIMVITVFISLLECYSKSINVSPWSKCTPYRKFNEVLINIRFLLRSVNFLLEKPILSSKILKSNKSTPLNKHKYPLIRPYPQEKIPKINKHRATLFTDPRVYLSDWLR